MCRFWIADNGDGIPSEHLDSIFDRYWQGRQSDSAGAGLGLYIAKGIVEAHGGTLRAHSVAGSGATLSFTLPLAAAAPAGETR
jgi:signal transduction histidine kinase